MDDIKEMSYSTVDAFKYSEMELSIPKEETKPYLDGQSQPGLLSDNGAERSLRSIEGLPFEMLQKIFRFCMPSICQYLHQVALFPHPAKIRGRLSLVSKTWRNVVEADSRLWTTFVIRTSSDFEDPSLDWLSERSPNLMMELFVHITPEWTKAMCTRLHRLLSTYKNIETFSLLADLDADVYHLFPFIFPARSSIEFPNLRVLRFMAEGARHVFPSLGPLRTSILEEVSLDAQCINVLFFLDLQTLTQLRKLTLHFKSSFAPSDQLLKRLGQCSNLKHLTWITHYDKVIGGIRVRSLRGLPSLRTFEYVVEGIPWFKGAEKYSHPAITFESAEPDTIIYNYRAKNWPDGRPLKAASNHPHLLSNSIGGSLRVSPFVRTLHLWGVSLDEDSITEIYKWFPGVLSVEVSKARIEAGFLKKASVMDIGESSFTLETEVESIKDAKKDGQRDRVSSHTTNFILKDCYFSTLSTLDDVCADEEKDAIMNEATNISLNEAAFPAKARAMAPLNIQFSIPSNQDL
ncbi:hypothetical protein M422DRAFT_775855 [Sphaerobolus stellatus SS14]|nr:hypothetical protein M422DRAFT_775855 [Sphaerobolus stellatus SS14]